MTTAAQRQREYRARRKTEGLCVVSGCSNKRLRNPKYSRCAKHVAAVSGEAQQRKRNATALQQALEDKIHDLEWQLESAIKREELAEVLAESADSNKGFLLNRASGLVRYLNRKTCESCEMKMIDARLKEHWNG